MRKQICCDTPSRLVKIGWLSFQPDGSISFGLNDRTFISPRFQVQHSIWNAYNRVGVRYVIPSHPEALHEVQNPHFTFHPAALFQLTGDRSGPKRKNFLFRGIADVGIALQQDGWMPWIRAVSSPLETLPPGGRRDDDIEVNELTISSLTENNSVRIELDFIKPSDALDDPPTNEWHIPWHGVAIRLRTGISSPQIATLSWFHCY